MGDVVAIYESHGSLVAEYQYDAWGKVTVINYNIQTDVLHEQIGTINPIRYRSYYYDVETKLYYLETRYYDPHLGRFLNPDSLDYLGDGEELNNYNLFAYCGNNPVMNTDPQGHKSIPWWGKLLIGAGFLIAGAAITAVTAGTGGGFMAAFGAALLTSTKAAIASAAISGGIGLLVGSGSGTIEGAMSGMLSGIVDGFMWGGIFAGGSQLLSGLFKGYAQTANHFGLLSKVKKSPLFSPDRLKDSFEIANIAEKGQRFYDYGGTILRFSKNFHVDVSTKSLLHLAALGYDHIPIGTFLAGIIGGF